ncbi:hypothetical protein ACIBIZ_44045 [Nonomuraea spiralis]|uniref:DUF4190 domain-containing protein n=1 Tax=Nonomuraea spiralis TaxID=46182 RepID=A0ABV5I9S1_9ACTN|nr:hypothetical protein [Nonomuraea spiralis]GGT06244.1 hypothetical protein GCM10010176_058280 [Nonomuraea spiralis]
MTSSQDPPQGDDQHTREGQWSQPPPYPQPPRRQGAQVLSIIGFVSAAVAVLFIPILFGLAGIVLGIVGHTRGESLGKWAAIAAAVCTVVGMILGALVTRALSA